MTLKKEHNGIAMTVELAEDTVAILMNEKDVKINQIDPLCNDPFKYTSVYVSVDAIIELGEYLKEQKEKRG